MLSFKQYLNEARGELDEAPQSQSMWYNSSKAKFVKVVQGGAHAHTVLSKSKEFGLKKADLTAKFGQLEGANFTKLIEFMKKNGWARVTVNSRERCVIEENNVTMTGKTAQTYDQKF